MPEPAPALGIRTSARALAYRGLTAPGRISGHVEQYAAGCVALK